MKVRNLEDIYQLSPMQKGMLFHTLYAPESGIYFNQVVWQIKGPLQLHWFEEAWKRVIQRHPILRTAFHWEDIEEPIQVVYRQVKLPLRHINWQDYSAEEQRNQLEELMLSEEQRGFDLTKPPLSGFILIAIAPETYWFIWNRHHILLDGWSQSIVLRELFTLYQWAQYWNRSDYDDETLLGKVAPYSTYIEWVQQQDHTQAAHFWQHYLGGIHKPTPLRSEWKFAHVPAQKRIFKELGFRFKEESTATLLAYLRQYQITLSTLIQGIWGLLLQFYSHQPEVMFGVTVSGRPTAIEGITNMVGLFINTLPVRFSVRDDMIWAEWLQNLQGNLLNLRQYEYSALVDIHGWSNIPRTEPLFDSIVVVENYPMDMTQLQEQFVLDISIFRTTMSRNNLPLTIRLVPGHELHLQLMYDQSRFEEDEIRRMLHHFELILEQTAKQMTQPVRALNNHLLAADEVIQAHRNQAFKAASLQKLKGIRRKTAE